MLYLIIYRNLREASADLSINIRKGKVLHDLNRIADVLQHSVDWLVLMTEIPLRKRLLELVEVEGDYCPVLRGTERQGREVKWNILLLQDVVRDFAVVKIQESYRGKPKKGKREVNFEYYFNFVLHTGSKELKWA